MARQDGRRRAGTRSPSFMHPSTCAAERGSWRGVAETPPSRPTVGAQGRDVHARPCTEPKRGGLRRHPPARPPRLFQGPPPWPASGGPERVPVPSCPAVDATGSGLRLCKSWHGLPTDRPPHTHAHEGGGVPNVRQRRGVQRARPVEVPWDRGTSPTPPSERCRSHPLSPPPHLDTANSSHARRATGSDSRRAFLPRIGGRACAHAHVCHPATNERCDQRKSAGPASCPSSVSPGGHFKVREAVSRPRPCGGGRASALRQCCCQSRRDCWLDRRGKFILVGGALGPHPSTALGQPCSCRNAPTSEGGPLRGAQRRIEKLDGHPARASLVRGDHACMPVSTGQLVALWSGSDGLLDGGGLPDRIGQRAAPPRMLEPPPSGGAVDTAVAVGSVPKRSCQRRATPIRGSLCHTTDGRHAPADTPHLPMATRRWRLGRHLQPPRVMTQRTDSSKARSKAVDTRVAHSGAKSTKGFLSLSPRARTVPQTPRGPALAPVFFFFACAWASLWRASCSFCQIGRFAPPRESKVFG